MTIAESRLELNSPSAAPTRATEESHTTIEEVQLDEAGSPPPAPQFSAWKTRALLLLLVGSITAAFLLGWLPKAQQRHALAEESRRRAQTPPKVEVLHPSPAEAAVEVSLPGEIQALEETVIFPRTSGYLKKWHVDIGDTVEAGQLLAEIDTPEVDQQLQKALAHVDQLEARRQVAETKLGLARFTLNRMKQLIESRAASQQEFDERQAEFSVADHQVKVADADVAAGMAELRRIEELQSFGKIYAPFAGMITERSIDLGQLVTSGNDQAQSLFRLVRIDRVRVVVHVPQVYASSIKQGQEAELVVREMPNRDFTGEVARSTRAIDLQTRTMRTEIEVENKDRVLLPGAYVQVRLKTCRENPPVTVPASALIFNADGCQIATVNSQDRIELRSVEVETDHGTTLGIATGVTPADRVVVNPGERIVNGMSVMVMDANAEN